SEGELELHLAGQHTTELLDHQFLHPLEQLDERMQALAAALGVPGRRPCPVRPQAAVAAFVGLFGAEDLTRGLRPLVFNQFDKRLPEVLGDLYEKLNDLLEDAGFGFQSRPAGARQVRSGGRPGAGDAAPAAAGGAGAAAGGWVPDGGVVEHIGGAGAAGGAAQGPGGGPVAAEALAGLAQGGGGRVAGAGLGPAGGAGPRGGGGPGPGGAGRGVAGGAVPAGTPGAAVGAPVSAGLQAAAAEGRPPRYRDVVREHLAHWRAAGGSEAPAPVRAGADVLSTEDLLNIAQILQG